MVTFELNEMRDSKQAKVHIKECSRQKILKCRGLQQDHFGFGSAEAEEMGGGEGGENGRASNRLITKGLEVLVAM